MTKWEYINEWSAGAEVIKVMQHANGVVARAGDGWVRYWPAGSGLGCHPATADGGGYTTLAAASRDKSRLR